MALSPKEAVFVREYLVHRNATKAVKAAGYECKNPRKYGSELLTKQDIKDAIADAEDALSARTQISNERVIRELGWIAFADLGDILDFTDEEPRLRLAHAIPVRARRAIASMKVKRYVEGKGKEAKVVEITEFKLCDKLAAVNALCKILGIIETDDVEELKKKLAAAQAVLAEVLAKRKGKSP